LFCGGGTGGHVYPALAVASELLARSPLPAVLFVGAKGEIEETLVPRSGVPLATVEGGGLHGVGAVNTLKNLFHLGRGFMQARIILGQFQPDVAFVTGGYVSVPVALAARLRRRPVVVFLPDVEPGRAIKLLNRLATRVAVSVQASAPYVPADKMVVTGYPLRSEMVKAKSEGREAAKHAFGIPPSERVLLVFGGSRGARTINRALGAILEDVLGLAHVIHVSGTLDAEECRSRRDALPQSLRARYHLFDYVHEMAQTLAAADLVVARAGAATLAEFPYFGLPALLVPYPHAWRYQKVNADFLAEQGAAMRINDEDMHERLLPTIEDLFRDEDRLKAMRERSLALAKPGAASKLADLLTALSNASQPRGQGTADA
jgi:UDP-N-acetylglucosamine--N-acetylmuramyl-(pentapeptide) pyrophosphoryl-undecaprenol N-acetylglucosamine transferase